MAFALRASHLAGQSLWSDEDITLDRAAQPLGELLARLPVEHTPGYFVLVHAWVRLAGDGDFALRFPSAVAGTAAVALAAFLGRRLVGRGTGLVLALAMAVSPFQVWYAQEARMYALLAALGLGTLAAALRAMTTRRRRWWIATGVVAALTAYTHYYGALTVAVLAMWAAADVAGRRSLRGWGLAGATGAALFAPWMSHIPGLLSFPGWREATAAGDAVATAVVTWAAGPTARPTWGQVAVALYGALAAAGAVRLAGRMLRRPAAPGPRRPGPGLALAFAAVPVVTLAALAWRRPDFDPRYFIAVVPGLYLVAAAGALGWPWPGARALAAGALLAVTVPSLERLYTDPSAQKQDYRPFVATVETAAGHEDTVLFLDGPSYGLTRRYEMADSPVKIVNLQSSGNRRRRPEERAERIADLAGEYPHLWLATDGAAEGLAQAWLEANAYPVDRGAFQTITLRRYFSPRPDPNVNAARGPDECHEGEAYCLAVGAPEAVAAGEPLPVMLLWRRVAAAASGLKVSLRLVAPDGTVVAAADRPADEATAPMSQWPIGQPVTDRQGLVVPEALPPGTYRLEAILYQGANLASVATWGGPAVVVRAAP